MSDHICKRKIVILKTKPKSAGISSRANYLPSTQLAYYKLDSDTVRLAIWPQIGRQLIEPDRLSERSQKFIWPDRRCRVIFWTIITAQMLRIPVQAKLAKCLAEIATSLPNRYSALCWRPVTHAQTWASYSALYRFGRLSEIACPAVTGSTQQLQPE